MVNDTAAINSQEFVAAVQPLLERRDVAGLHDLLCKRWSKEQIVSVLRGRDQDARKVGLVALSLVGCCKCLCELSRHLQDPDPVVNQMAEHAIWSIWFRQGSSEANCRVHKGVKAMNAQKLSEAIEHFSQAIELSPDFAEAWHQRSTAYYLQENFHRARADAAVAVELNPYHFGAWSSLGHSCVALEKFERAIEAYKKALSINPHLDCLRETIDELRSRLCDDKTV